jgi:hypothetical protein
MIGKKTIFKNGQMVNGLKYIDDDGYHILPSGVKIRKAIFECECGGKFSVVVKSVVYGRTKSCGCLRIKGIKEGNEKHGFRNDPLYKTWNSQKSRCLNPKATGYKYWGGRGIKFSDEFLDISVWMNYVKSLPNYENRESKKLTLDRINNDGNYERGNLRWIDRSTQNKNRRKNANY